MTVLTFDNPEEVARAAADRFSEVTRSAIDSHGSFSVALSGGTTPRRAYELLGSDEYRNRIEWSRTHIFFADERNVPHDHSESNYRMVRESLLSHVSIPVENIHAIPGEGDPVANARQYESELRSFFSNSSWPRFDLIFLGLGDDGHTASLFPSTGALNENKAWVSANWVEKLDSWRITLTAPAINHAANILFLVTGSSKMKALWSVLKGPRNIFELPAQMIQPVDGSLEWLVDKAAAQLL